MIASHCSWVLTRYFATSAGSLTLRFVGPNQSECAIFVWASTLSVSFTNASASSRLSGWPLTMAAQPGVPKNPSFIASEIPIG
jgi:hypothetical protein